MTTFCALTPHTDISTSRQTTSAVNRSRTCLLSIRNYCQSSRGFFS